MTTIRTLPCGPRGLLLEVDSTDQVIVLARAVTAARLAGVEEVVPAARTVLVLIDPGITTPDDVAGAVGRMRLDQATDAELGPLVEIPVVYDGADLEDVARRVGMTSQEVVERHAAGRYTVAFCGFTPGFAYQTGLDPALHVPRRAEPRAGVPRGAVAIAGEWTAIYPSASPGGWQLLGRTDATIWQADRSPPALLTPGTRVRFVRVAT